ncbi:MAG: hypothetical protein ABSH28_05180 [Acidobacteriota bacterium]|jgi:hypothetical protein
MEATAKTIEDFIREERESEEKARFKGFRVSDLRILFEKISDPADWRSPIAVTVSGESVLAVCAAIEYFTATTPKVGLDTVTMRYLIESIGYRMGPAGDH